MKVLYVSDNIGTPIHPRGIYHYSVGLLQSLSATGAEVTLLVEGRKSFFSKLFPPKVSKTAALASVYGFLAQNDNQAFGEFYRPNWRGEWSARTFGYDRAYASILNAAYLFRNYIFWTRPPARVVENTQDQLAYVPSNVTHLRYMANFLVVNHIYTQSFAAACLGIRSPMIDARAYDTVIIDTPNYIRLRKGRNTKVYSVVHDVIPLTDSRTSGSSVDSESARRIFLRKLKITMRGADHFICVSAFTKRLFERFFEPGKPISILHPTVDDYVLKRDEVKQIDLAVDLRINEGLVRQLRTTRPVKGIPSEDEIKYLDDKRAKLLSRINGKSDYLVTIISNEHRKNLRSLIQAMSYLDDKKILVVIGDVTGEIIKKFYLKGIAPEIAERVVFTGYVDRAHKFEIIKSSHAMIFPSLVEGFGIPIAEALLMGKPTVCSDNELFREIAGDLLFYFDPQRPKSIADAIDRCLNDIEGATARVETAIHDLEQRFIAANQRELVAKTFAIRSA